MGTTMAFYLIENRDLTPAGLKKGMDLLRAETKERRQRQEALLDSLLLSFIDRERFQEVKDQMRRESPEAFAHISRLLGQEEEPKGNIIPFPGTVLPEEPQDREKGPVLAYRSDARWLPLFEETLCEGCTASSRDTERLARKFGAPVLAFSIFDSDILFLSYSDPGRGFRADFAQPNFDEAQEMIDEPYRMEFPAFLCAYADEEALRKVWEGEEVFADDRMHKLCQLIGAEVLYDSVELPQGFQPIV